MSGSVRGSYVKISDCQKEILVRYYDTGMTGKGAKHADLIESAANETGLCVDKVKKWIGNETAKRKADCFPEERQSKKRKLSFAKGPSQYNIFCSEFFKSDQCPKTDNLAAKNAEASKVWNSMPVDKKKEYADKANELKLPEVSKLTPYEKSLLIRQHQRRLLSEIAFLEQLGCESAAILIDETGELFNFGSAGGHTFWACNPDVNVKFRELFASTKKQYTYKDIMTLFNHKYSIAIGKPCRVPYQSGGFKVEGLPSGIMFKKPFYYGRCQLNAIMKNQDKIRFITDQENEYEITGVDGPDQYIDATQHACLVKIVGEEVTQRVLSGGGKINEEEVEVLNLQMNQEELLMLHYQCSKYFERDAWIATKENLQHSEEVTDVILPMYTEADDEQFWLFCCREKPNVISKLLPRSKLHGHWLDKVNVQDKSYTVLKSELTVVNGISIIGTDMGPIYYCSNDFSCESENFVMSKCFSDCILSVLETNGFLKVSMT